MDTLEPIADDAVGLADTLAGQGVKYAIACWVDVLGRPKSKVVPIDHLPNMLAGSERYTPRGMGGIGQMDPVEDEIAAVPDRSTLKILPWDTRFAWMIADMSFGGREPYALCPRSILKRQVERAHSAGFVCQLGVEPEFYAFRPESLEPGRGTLTPDRPQRGDRADPGLRRGIGPGLDAVPGPDGRLHEGVGLWPVQLRRRGR